MPAHTFYLLSKTNLETRLPKVKTLEKLNTIAKFPFFSRGKGGSMIKRHYNFWHSLLIVGVKVAFTIPSIWLEFVIFSSILMPVCGHLGIKITIQAVKKKRSVSLCDNFDFWPHNRDFQISYLNVTRPHWKTPAAEKLNTMKSNWIKIQLGVLTDLIRQNLGEVVRANFRPATQPSSRELNSYKPLNLLPNAFEPSQQKTTRSCEIMREKFE